MRRKVFGKKRLAGVRHPKKRQGSGRKIASFDIALAPELMALLQEQEQGLTLAELAHLLPVPLAFLRKSLQELVAENRIRKKGGRFFTGSEADGIKAILELHPKGYAFAMVQGETKGGKDVFIAPARLAGASHGDAVLIEITGIHKGRREGRVIRVLSRAVSKLCGIFTRERGEWLVLPDDTRLPYTIQIAERDRAGAEEGMAVLVEIVDYGSARQNPAGRVVELLGDPGDVRVQIRMAVFAAELAEHFPAEVEAAALSLEPVSGCPPGYQDLRHLLHVTIDDENARDFDDAICVEANEKGYTLYVSIADVSHYVQPGSLIDKEAYHRGTSVYFPDRVLPMLPERLSNDLCSLVPGQDRPAFTAILDYDRSGRRTGERYTKSLIRSGKRLTYTAVQLALFEKEEESLRAHADVLPMLKQALSLAILLKKERVRRGGLDLEIPESKISVAHHQVKDISIVSRNQAHMLIEDCMLAANEAVAETLCMRQRPVLYRIHEHPDPGKLENFQEMAKLLGLNIPPIDTSKDTEGPGTEWFRSVLAQTKGGPLEYVINNLLLRSMQQARYSSDHAGHFGLAAPFYLHFTSPIRRYPDLVAHRALQALLGGKGIGVEALLDQEQADLSAAALHLSRCERKAVEVERDVQARCAALYMKDRTGEHFNATISGVSAFGLYLTLEGSLISGMVPLTSMKDDFYLYDSRRHRLLGETSKVIHQLGDRVRVCLEHVDLLTKRLSFTLTHETPTL